MHLTISSRDYLFESGRAAMIMGGWDENSSASFEAFMAASNSGISELSISNNMINPAALSGPGAYRLFMVDLMVRRKSDAFSTRVSMYVHPVILTLSSLDLGREEAEIKVNPKGLYRVTIIDRALRPLPGARLTLFMGELTVGVSADESGSFCHLTDSAGFHFCLEEGTGITVVPI